jgi:hypothetical protein
VLRNGGMCRIRHTSFFCFSSGLQVWSLRGMMSAEGSGVCFMVRPAAFNLTARQQDVVALCSQLLALLSFLTWLLQQASCFVAQRNCAACQ